MRIADIIAEMVSATGTRHVFMITGGGAMHLDDAFGRRRDLTLVCNHHEQASAMAAEGYARLAGGLGVALVTSGPGGANTVTGVLGQWHDSVSVLYISGQVRSDLTVASTGLPLRQLGDQEADIVRLVAPITKYAAVVDDPGTVRYHFEKAVWLATHGRPGPVWLDVPLDVQAADVDPASLHGFDPEEFERPEPALRAGRVAPAVRPSLPPWPAVASAKQSPGAYHGHYDRALAARQAAETVDRLLKAERPVVLAGSAIRGAGATHMFLDVAARLGVPICTAWNAHDLLWEDHPLYAGRPATLGDRAGNLVVQNADVLLSLGCRLNVRQVGYESRAFAHHAFRIVVDIDEAELAKPTIFPDLAVHADVRFFLESMLRALGVAAEASPSPSGAESRPESHAQWRAWCRERRARYPAVSEEQRRRNQPLSGYAFIERLAQALEPDDVVVCANGAACVIPFQAFAVKRGQRLVANSGTAAMGYDLPAAVGAAFACGAKGSRGEWSEAAGDRVICLAGDGSIQMNIQELQTIVHHRLPVKIFVLDNGGYSSIRQTQDNLFAGHRVGEGPATGVSFPDMIRVAEAYGLPARRVKRAGEVADAIEYALGTSGPCLVDVVLDPEEQFAPKVIAERRPDGSLVSKPLEDMFPFLDRAELADNMIGPAYDATVR